MCRPCGAGCCRPGYGVGRESAVCIANGENGKSMRVSWSRWMEVFMTGWRAAWFLDEHGRRCQRRYAGAAGARGDDLGGGSSVACLGEEIRHTGGAVYGSEERRVGKE